ncbi:hypothetical protein A2V71_01645 [Candidatus Berkelbacteria bacterium RBG_13_40_8]|uniref:EamA domain-containing protein n=1 Tax=Candidatus Berkelbacteria bacterium RBG_13_40_8 TaxID=1797467 RepID=A0A1F5DPL7_9BACT|nr:MAG: hypothetical protein A2V71_01645 [Candidatus Berkelbacteria bacterium RBG_13_40_8]
MFPLIATVSQAIGVFVDKIILTRKQVTLHVYIPILFLFLCLTVGVLFPFLGWVNADFFKPLYLLLFLAMIVAAIIWNLFYYKGLQSEKIHEYELIVMFQPLLTIILATLLFKGERNIHIVIASVIAALALIISHIRKQHFELSPGAWSLVWAVIFMSIELIILKELLNVFSPVALYFFRTGILFIFFFLYYRPQVNKIAPANLYLILASAALGTVQMVAKFYGFEAYGVVYTSLILILSPLLVYALSMFLLHERLKLRTVVSFLVILGCIVYATTFGK